MRKKWLAAGMLLVAMASVTACGKKETDRTEKNANVESSFETKDLKMDTCIMAVGDEEVSLNEYLFYVYQLRSAYDETMTTDVWGYEYKEGENLGTYFKKQIVKEIAQVKIICTEAEKQGYELTEEEANEANVEAGQFMENLSSDAEEYRLSRELVANIYKEHALAKKMYDVIGGTIQTNVSDEEAKQVSVAYVEVLTKGTDRDGNEVDLSEEEKQSALQRANQLKDSAAATEDFVEFARSNSDVAEYEKKIRLDTKPAQLIEAAFAMENGQVSDVIATEEGYYILYCQEAYDPEKQDQYKESILEDREKEAFQKAYAAWKVNYKVVVSEPLLEQLSFE